MINLKFNYPSLNEEAIVVQRLLCNMDYHDLLSFPSYQGKQDHLEIARKWMGIPDHNYPGVSNIVLCNSGNHALSCALQALRIKHAGIITEPFTYPAFKSIAVKLGFTLIPAAFDSEGMTLEGLEEAQARSGARILYIQPTIHNPTCAVMSLKRRESIAEFARQKNLFIVEDDAYRFLHPTPPLRFLDLVPEHTLHIFSLAKPFNSLLKTAYLVAPDFLTDEIVDAARLNSSGHSALLGSVAASLLRDDTLQKIIEQKRNVATQLQSKLLPMLNHLPYNTFPSSFHLWLKLPSGKKSSALAKQLLEAGIVVPAGSDFSVNNDGEGDRFLRIALGAEKDILKLEHSLNVILKMATY